MGALEFFHCDRMKARLTTAGCSRMWLSVEARPPHAGEGRTACVGCEIGARNSGVDIEVAARAARAQELTGICARCLTGGHIRMIGGTHCVSCYNRLREARIGRDRRGRQPRFSAAIHPVTLVLVGVTAKEQCRRYPRVTSRPEAILLAAKESGGAAFTVGWQRLSELPPLAMIELAPDFAPSVRRPGPRRKRRSPFLPGSILLSGGFQPDFFHA